MKDSIAGFFLIILGVFCIFPDADTGNLRQTLADFGVILIGICFLYTHSSRRWIKGKT